MTWWMQASLFPHRQKPAPGFLIEYRTKQTFDGRRVWQFRVCTERWEPFPKLFPTYHDACMATYAAAHLAFVDDAPSGALSLTGAA